jgi:TctA family transporter
MAELLQPHVLLPWLAGMVFGIFVGATPGLTATMAVALIVPISFRLDPTAGLAMIIGVSFTAIFAGDIPATFLRIPGTPASAAATLDGYPLARRGKGSLALTLDLFCSAIGGLIGVGTLMLVAPPLASLALEFSFSEMFWLAILGLSLSALVSTSGAAKGWLAAILGMLLSTVGIDVVRGVPRFTLGSEQLLSGLDFIPVMIGLFGLSEVLRNFGRPASKSDSDVADSGRLPIKAAWLEILLHWPRVLLSALMGTVIGALPGAGADIAAWGAYGVARKTSRKASDFGTGIVEGVVAPTSANNAAVAGAWIPALVFGIPGDAVTAIVLGALMMYNIKPGPMIFEQSGTAVDAIFAIALLTQLLLIPAGLAGIKAFGWIMRLPRAHVMAGVVVFSLVGSYSLRNNIFDVYVMVAFGVVGLILESRRIPLAPLILGLILGPMVEENLRVGLISGDGSLAPFFLRPFSAALVALLAAIFIVPSLVRWTRRQSAAERG